MRGLGLFACAINSSASSQYLVLDGLTCRYLSHYAYSDTGDGFDVHMEDSGIVLQGSHHILRNSELAYSAGNGVTMLGDHSLVENCLIHDVDYLEVDCGAINNGRLASTSADHEMRYNTAYNSGRGIFIIRPLVRGYIHHNDIYRSVLRTTDSGGIYTFTHDGQNTDISYNRFHDHVCGENGAAGIYLDNVSSNFRVHHNLIYNCVNALEYNLPSTNILWYNNTALAFNKSLTGSFSGSQAGTQVSNNIFNTSIVTFSGATVSNNLPSTTDPLFVSPAGLDFRLQAASLAHDGGIVLSPYTDGYEGAKPDLGAIEYGQTLWVAGSSLAVNPPTAPANLTAVTSVSGTQLSWSDNSSNESSFVIERSADNRTYDELVRLPANATSYLDGSNKRGYSYYYRVRADESAFSNYALAPSHDAFSIIQGELYDAQSGTITISPLAPIVIGHCDAGQWVKYAGVNFGSGATQISLRLSYGLTALNNFVEVRLGSPTGTRIANINVLSTGSYNTYIDLSAPVTAVSGMQDLFLVFKGGSGVCNIDYFNFTAATPVPLAVTPGGISVTALSASQIQVAWTLPGGAEEGFRLERAMDNQTFVEIGGTAASGSSFVDASVPEGTTYYYRVRSYNGQGFSSYTPIAAATSLTFQQAWRKQYFGNTANTGNGADGADRDGDGLTNLVEFAFGLNPLNGGSSALPPAQVSGGNLLAGFTQPAAVSGVSYSAEWSPTMAAGSWTLIADQGSGGAHLFSVALGTKPKVFLRLIVTSSSGSVTTPAEGCLNYSLGAGTTTPLGLPLLNSPTFVGSSAAVTTTTLRASGAAWSPDQFAQPGTPFFALLLSGGQIGRSLPVLGNTVDTLTLDVGAAPLTASASAPAFAVAAGDRFELVAADTLASLLGDGSVASPLQVQGGTSPTTADLVQLFNGVKWISYYFDTTAGRQFWVKLNGDGMSQNSLALYPDTALLLTRPGAVTGLALAGRDPRALAKLRGRQQAVATSLALSGRVPLTPLATWLPGGARAVALRFPADATLGSLGLAGPGSWVASDLSFSADKINLFNGTKWVAYWKTLSGLWKKVGGNQSDQSSQLIPAGSCLFIQKQGTGVDAASYFTQALPYPAN